MKRYIADIDLSQAKILKTDVAIIGSGIAGLYAAYHLDAGLNCTLFTKQGMGDSSSRLAQGGIAAVTEKDDRMEYHLNDTLKAGAGLCVEPAVRVIVEEGPDDIDELVKLGVNFDMDKNGHLLTAQEGGHTMRRILRCGGDATGAEIVEKLRQSVGKRKNVSVFKDSFVTDILTDDNGACGLVVKQGDQWFVYKTNYIIIATGGLGQIYRYTTNPSVATGDGMALAARAGAELKDMEFVQFHPTGLYTIENRNHRCFLISEAVRGEGAKLYNEADERFMVGRHELNELAPRDIVAMEIYKEIQKQSLPYVKLDITHESEEFLENRFPTIFNWCKDIGIDISKEFIPVGPVQHYMMGGIKTNLYGITNIKGLFAIGEVANTGVHGANRLASNSTLECVVFGRRCAEYINRNFKALDKTINYPKLTNQNSDMDIENEIENLKGIMVEHCGIVRNEQNLQLGLDYTQNLIRRLENISLTSVRSMELYNMVTVANNIITSALKRKKSVGSHYRDDETSWA